MSNQLNAQTVHTRLRQALTALREAECNAVILFAEILQRRLFRELGFASIHIYAGEALGFSRSKTYEFIRLAEALDKLPQLKAGIKAGKVPWTKARELVKVATPLNEKRWIEIASNGSRRELVEQIGRSRALRDRRKRESGQGELLAKHPVAKPAQERSELVNEQAASKPEQERSELQAKHPVANSAPRHDKAPTGYPAAEPAPPEAAPALSEAASMPPEAAPVQSVSLRLDPLQRAHFDSLVEKLMKRHRCGRDEIVLIALDALLAADERSPRSEKSTRVDAGAPYQVIVHQCETCKSITVGPERRLLNEAEKEQVKCDSMVLAPGKRNRSSIPPSRRRAVLKRDGHRCRVRGCGSTHFLEVHHLKSRSEGGSNSEANLVVMCSNCHGHLHERRGVLPPLREL